MTLRSCGRSEADDIGAEDHACPVRADDKADDLDLHAAAFRPSQKPVSASASLLTVFDC